MRQKEAAEEASTRKRKAEAEAREALQKIVQDMPPPEASLQDRRDWELKLLQGVHRNLRSPRTRHKVGLYVAKKQKTESGTEKKAIVAELMKLKDDGGQLDGGDHPETYNGKLLQKVTKKAVKKEEAKKKLKIKEAKKFLSIEKMKATKLKKKKNKEELEAAAAAAAAAEAEASVVPK